MRLIDLLDSLIEFKEHCENKGAQMAHNLIKDRFLSDAHLIPVDDSPEAAERVRVQVETVKAILALIRGNFIP